MIPAVFAQCIQVNRPANRDVNWLGHRGELFVGPVTPSLVWLSNIIDTYDVLRIKHLGVKKGGANQKQHCKQAGTTKRFDIS